MVDSLDGGELSTSDALGGFHHSVQCILFRDKANPMPFCDAVDKDALDGPAVEIHQNLKRLSSASEGRKHTGIPSVEGPREGFRDVDT